MKVSQEQIIYVHGNIASVIHFYLICHCRNGKVVNLKSKFFNSSLNINFRENIN